MSEENITSLTSAAEQAGFRPNAEQAGVISDTSDNILVSASAGSGKTTVMIEKIISVLLEGGALDEMAVCTFTKAAAADMKTKLFKRLDGLSREGNPAARSALKNLPSAQISTLHSFCGQLIKSYFYAADIDPGFEMLDESDAASLLEACAARIVDRFCAEKNEDFAFMYEVLLRRREAGLLKSIIKRLYIFATVQPDFDAFMDGCAECGGDAGGITDKFKERYEKKFDAMFKTARLIRNRCAASGFIRNLPFAAALEQAIAAREYPDFKVSGALPEGEMFAALNDEFKSLKKAYTDALDSYKEMDLYAAPAKTRKYAEILARMAKELKNEYAKEKQRRAVADYSDLEYYALQILTNTDARESIARKYKYLFVDEYQDINAAQERIISQLSAKKFFVGDVKQSIYGFRLCDPDIFVSKYDGFKANGGGSAHDLNSNFRSADGILCFCNAVFGRIMTKDFGGADYENSAAFILKDGQKAQAGSEKEIRRDVKIYIAKGGKKESTAADSVYSVMKAAGEDNNDDTLAHAEAGLVVGRVLDLISEGGADIRLSDIAVLLRAANTGFANILKDKLKSAGIPAFLSVKKSAADCPDIDVLLSYLKVIDNRKNDIALAAALISCLGGFSDSDLSLIRAAYPEGYFYEAAEYCRNLESFPLKSRLCDFFARLDRYTELSGVLKVSNLTGAVCSENDYFKYILAKKDGAVKARELAAFLDVIENSAYNVSLYEFLDAIGKNMPEIEIEPESDSVKIMTVHASKGLEFGHVIFPNLSRKFNNRDLSGPILLDSEYGIALKYWNPETRASEMTSLYYAVKQNELRKRREEEMRILYVALTRAKKTLTLIGSEKEGGGDDCPDPADASCYMEMLAPQIQKYGQYIPQAECAAPAAPPKVTVMYRKPDPALLKKISEYTGFVYPRVNLPVKSSVSALITDGDENGANDGQYFEFADSERAAERGNAYHKLMQEIDFSGGFEAEFARFCEKFPHCAELIKKDDAEAAFVNMRGIINGRKFYRELPFVVSAPAALAGFESGGNILIQGIIDIIVTGENGCEIFDYKTGNPDAPTLEKYSRQLKMYAYATQKILKKDVTRTALYLFSKKELLDVMQNLEEFSEKKC